MPVLCAKKGRSAQHGKTLARLENLRKERLGFPRGKLLEERVPHLLRRHGIDGLKGGITRLAERPQHAAGTDIVGGDGTVLPGLGIGDRAQMPVLQEIHVRCAVLDVRLGMQKQ